MGQRSYNPTSVASRRLQSKQRQAHRIKLRKQLSKARSKLDAACSESPKGLEPAIDEAISQLISGRATPAATKAPVRSTKPNPAQRALKKKEKLDEEKREKAEWKMKIAQEREVARQTKIMERERLRKKLTAKTRSGQPKLSRHIDVLLEKIQKSQ